MMMILLKTKEWEEYYWQMKRGGKREVYTYIEIW